MELVVMEALLLDVANALPSAFVEEYWSAVLICVLKFLMDGATWYKGRR